MMIVVIASMPTHATITASTVARFATIQTIVAVVQSTKNGNLNLLCGRGPIR